MHHDVAALIPALLGRLRSGGAHLDRFGLTVVPIHPAANDELRIGHPAQEAVPTEHDPPLADRIVVTNLSDHAIVLATGTIATGGHCARALSETTVVEAHETHSIPVEAIEPRWWHQGTLRWAGSLEPALVAAVMLVHGADGGLRARARTALWSVPGLAPDESPVLSSADSLPVRAKGWLLYHERGFLAARLPGHDRPSLPSSSIRAGVRPPPPQVPGEPLADVTARLNSIRWTNGTGAARTQDGHTFAAQATRSASGIAELSLVRLTADLLRHLLHTPG